MAEGSFVYSKYRTIEALKILQRFHPMIALTNERKLTRMKSLNLASVEMPLYNVVTVKTRTMSVRPAPIELQ